MKKVAIQGIKGSYHHQVALNYFGKEIEIIEFLSFDELANSIANNNCDYGVMAIENSIAGSIIPNYALIDNLKLKIAGEYYININHQLMAINGSKIEDLEVVASHPMALLQCKNFFKKYPQITLVEDKDTAEVALRIQRDNIKKMGAIASVHASELYNLNILSKNMGLFTLGENGGKETQLMISELKHVPPNLLESRKKSNKTREKLMRNLKAQHKIVAKTKKAHTYKTSQIQ